MKSSTEKSEFNKDKIVSKSSEEAKNVPISSDSFSDSSSQSLEFAMRHSNANNHPTDYLLKENLSEKPYSEHQKNPDTLEEEEKFIFVKIRANKIGKKHHHKDKKKMKIFSVLDVDPVYEEINELEDILLKNLEQNRGKNDKLFSSKINYTKDGYLSGRILKIYLTNELVTVPFDSLSKLDVSGIPNVLDKRPKAFNIPYYSEKSKDGNFTIPNNTFKCIFSFSEPEDNLQQSIETLDLHYASQQESEEDEVTVVLNNALIDLSNVIIDGFVLSNLTKVFKCLSKFRIFMLTINCLSSHMKEVLKQLCPFLKKTDVTYAIFNQSVFDLQNL
jgi:hypothetical protein